MKPFRLTGESRYIGLPLGFGFLGASYAFSAVANLQLSDFSYGWWVQLFFRAFSFLFLAVTYYFSKSATRHDLIWNITLGVLVAVLAVLILLATISPQQLGPTYQFAQVYVRVFNVVCLSYIVIHVLRSHVRHPDPTTLLIPFGYIFIGLGQFLQIVWAVDRSTLAFWTGLARAL